MTAIIIEDEPLAVLELESVLEEIAPDIKVVARLGSVREGVKWLQENEVQLIFTDIHLGDGRSFEIFKQVKIDTPVIFITAYDKYVLQAFKTQGVAYILKPFDPEDIQQALDKVKSLYALGGKEGSRTEVIAGGTETYQQRFLVQIGAKMRSVPAEEVAYFMADGKYLLLYTFDGGKYIVGQTVSGIEDRLDPKRFFRINRKFIVNFQAIQDMIRYSNNRIKIVLLPAPPENVEALVSADRVREFRDWLNR